MHAEGCDNETCWESGDQALMCSTHDTPADCDRRPYVQRVSVCRRCGETWPEMFMAPNEIWEAVVDPSQRKYAFCLTCFLFMAAMRRVPVDMAEVRWLGAD